jgi:excisionase family DNA binding protein
MYAARQGIAIFVFAPFVALAALPLLLGYGPQRFLFYWAYQLRFATVGGNPRIAVLVVCGAAQAVSFWRKNTMELLTPGELAEILGVSEFTVLKMARQKTIPEVQFSRKCHRFLLADVVDAVRKRTAEKSGKRKKGG